jgi:hypothetical protein
MGLILDYEIGSYRRPIPFHLALSTNGYHRRFLLVSKFNCSTFRLLLVLIGSSLEWRYSIL